MKRFGKIFITGAILMTTVIMAQNGPKLEINIQETKMNMSTAEENGSAPVSYAPGDTILYTLYAKNTGNAVMNNPVVLDPVPEGTAYVVDSATGSNCRILFSVNKGVQYSVWPVMVSGTSANGTPIQREATNEEVTHIKWLIQDPIPAGGQKTLTFKVVVK